MKRSMLWMAIPVALVMGCATMVPTVPLSAAHGLVVMHNSVGGTRVHPVQVIMIDGVNLPAGRQSYALAPGSHTLRVVGLLKDAHLRSPPMDPAYARRSNRQPYTLTIDVEEGMRYVIAAQFNGPTASDWEPVILRTEPITR
ncbi:MAG: hypothetical protein WD081_08865 [Gammaproteobacteria bacterium]